jgi:hypothetical protein
MYPQGVIQRAAAAGPATARAGHGASPRRGKADTVPLRQKLYRVAVRKDGGAVREGDFGAGVAR